MALKIVKKSQMISTPQAASYTLARFGLEDPNQNYEYSEINEMDIASTAAAAPAPAVVSVSSQMAGVEETMTLLLIS